MPLQHLTSASHGPACEQVSKWEAPTPDQASDPEPTWWVAAKGWGGEEGRLPRMRAAGRRTPAGRQQSHTCSSCRRSPAQGPARLAQWSRPRRAIRGGKRRVGRCTCLTRPRDSYAGHASRPHPCLPLHRLPQPGLACRITAQEPACVPGSPG